MKLYTFYYHPKGMDGNGNYGPVPTEKGWTAIAIPISGDPRIDGQGIPWPDMGEMVPHLPLSEQKRIKNWIEKERVEQKCSQCMEPACRDVEHIVADYAGWAVPFTIHSEGSWKNDVLNMEFE